MNTPPLRVRADTRCLKEQRWAYDKGICIQPAGHEKKCRFVWAEGVEVLGGEAAATDGLSADRTKPCATTGAFGAISPPQPRCGNRN